MHFSWCYFWEFGSTNNPVMFNFSLFSTLVCSILYWCLREKFSLVTHRSSRVNSTVSRFKHNNLPFWILEYQALSHSMNLQKWFQQAFFFFFKKINLIIFVTSLWFQVTKWHFWKKDVLGAQISCLTFSFDPYLAEWSDEQDDRKLEWKHYSHHN